jgi:hypothetical protein
LALMTSSNTINKFVAINLTLFFLWNNLTLLVQHQNEILLVYEIECKPMSSDNTRTWGKQEYQLLYSPVTSRHPFHVISLCFMLN